MNNNILSQILLEQTGAKEILKTELIQTLWSNYGELSRFTLDNGSVIVKFIKLAEPSGHPRGWNSNLGHQRKVKSYQVEANWYGKYTTPIKEAYIPKVISTGSIENYQYLIIEDLAQMNFETRSTITDKEVKFCLKWLAHFHKHYLDQAPKDLWDIGTYWHLDTRPEELEALDDLELKKAAPLIDKKLNEAKYKTIVHGDAKLTNFLLNETRASAVDFQYVGGGVGVKDLAYFLSSIYNEEELFENEKACLDYYFKELSNPEVEKEWRELYPLAWCDFYRFLQGWSPGHWKVNSYSEQMKESVLKCL